MVLLKFQVMRDPGRKLKDARGEDIANGCKGYEGKSIGDGRPKIEKKE